MKTSRTRRRTASGAPGLKVLLTAGALAATVGGWAVFAAQDASTAAQAVPAPVVEAASIQEAEANPPPQAVPTLRVVRAAPEAVGPDAPVAVARSSR